jgi:hypothetical protein
MRDETRAQAEIDYGELLLVILVAIGLAVVMLLLAEYFFEIPLV